MLDVVVPFLDTRFAGTFLREFIANKVIGASGQFTFVCVPDGEMAGESISGCIFLIPNFNNSARLRVLLGRFDYGECEPEHYTKCRDETILDSETIAKSVAKFTLLRNGLFELETESNASDADAKILDRFIANQFFFFFKDIAHVHQHHDPSHDAITELTLIEKGETDSWIPETQHALYRAVIRYKRFRNSRALFRASGILAYAREFERAHAEGHPKFKLFNYETLDASLSVSREEIQHVDAKRSAGAETIRNYFFTGFGIAFSLFAFAQLDKNFIVVPNENMIWLAKVFATEPFKFTGFLFFASYVAGYFTNSRDPADSSPVRALLQWFQGIRMRWFVAANLIMTLVFALVFYYVFFVLFAH